MMIYVVPDTKEKQQILQAPIICGKDFSKQDWSKENFAHKQIFGNCIFIATDLTDAIFTSARFIPDEKNNIINFSSADLSGANFEYVFSAFADGIDEQAKTFGYNAIFRGANLSKSNFRYSSFHFADFSYANLDGADFSEAVLFSANFSGAINIRKAKFAGADLRNVNFSGMNLAGVDFSGANLAGANFMGADLTGADFNGAILDGACFGGANISLASFINVENPPIDGATALGTIFSEEGLIGFYKRPNCYSLKDYTFLSINKNPDPHCDLEWNRKRELDDLYKALQDYTKGSAFGRLVFFAWNRHYVSQVEKFLETRNNRDLVPAKSTMEDEVGRLLSAVRALKLPLEFNEHGSLACIIRSVLAKYLGKEAAEKIISNAGKPIIDQQQNSKLSPPAVRELPPSIYYHS